VIWCVCNKAQWACFAVCSIEQPPEFLNVRRPARKFRSRRAATVRPISRFDRYARWRRLRIESRHRSIVASHRHAPFSHCINKDGGSGICSHVRAIARPLPILPFQRPAGPALRAVSKPNRRSIPWLGPPTVVDQHGTLPRASSLRCVTSRPWFNRVPDFRLSHAKVSKRSLQKKSQRSVARRSPLAWCRQSFPDRIRSPRPWPIVRGPSVSGSARCMDERNNETSYSILGPGRGDCFRGLRPVYIVP